LPTVKVRPGRERVRGDFRALDDVGADAPANAMLRQAGITGGS
jgi:hypothetical protein